MSELVAYIENIRNLTELQEIMDMYPEPYRVTVDQAYWFPMAAVVREYRGMRYDRERYLTKNTRN